MLQFQPCRATQAVRECIHQNKLCCVCCHAVPICAPGQELDLDLLVCYGCEGNTVSPGGKVSQGMVQPRCEECPWGTAANETHQVCYTGTHTSANTPHKLAIVPSHMWPHSPALTGTVLTRWG